MHIEMILLNDTVEVQKHGYFMVEKNTVFCYCVWWETKCSIGCRSQQAVEAIIKDCFNRSHAVRCGETENSDKWFDFFKLKFI